MMAPWSCTLTRGLQVRDPMDSVPQLLSSSSMRSFPARSILPLSQLESRGFSFLVGLQIWREIPQPCTPAWSHPRLANMEPNPRSPKTSLLTSHGLLLGVRACRPHTPRRGKRRGTPLATLSRHFAQRVVHCQTEQEKHKRVSLPVRLPRVAPPPDGHCARMCTDEAGSRNHPLKLWNFHQLGQHRTPQHLIVSTNSVN